MRKIFVALVCVAAVLICQSCFREESNGFINRLAICDRGGTFIVKGDVGIYSLEIGEGNRMDAYHEEFIEPDTIVVKSKWLEAKARIGSDRLIVTVSPLDGGKKRLAPITLYSGGYEYSLIWILQHP